MYLLDTFAVICLTSAPDRMRPDARELLTTSAEPIFFSPISVWEIEIKVSNGKLTRPSADVAGAMRRLGYLDLPITADHATRVGQLDPHHRDPFDRMLVAQAQVEGLILVTPDALLAAYGVPVLAC